CFFSFFFLMILRPPISTLFPYTTLFRSSVKEDYVMWKELISIVTITGAASGVAAQTVTDPAEITSRLKFWTQETADPVYYGEVRSEEHTSELQSRSDLVCRLLLEKKKKT